METSAPRPENAYSYGWKIVKAHFLELLFLVIIIAFIQSPMGWFQKDSLEFSWDKLDGIVHNTVYNLYSMAYGLLIATPFQFGATYLFLKTVRGEKFEMSTIVSPYNRLVDVIFAQILTVVIVIIGFVMFIIPGIILLIRLSFVRYLVMDKGLDAMSALKESWRMTANYGWTIFGMALLAIPIFFAGLIVFFVGIFVSIMWINTAFASLYFAVDSLDRPQENLGHE